MKGAGEFISKVHPSSEATYPLQCVTTNSEKRERLAKNRGTDDPIINVFPIEETEKNDHFLWRFFVGLKKALLY